MNIPKVRIANLEPRVWKENKNASCYLYAINVAINEYLLVGELIGEKCTKDTSDKRLIKILKKELKFIGYQVEETRRNIKLKENELKICIARDSDTGYYHFFRQDDNGIWTHKFPEEFPEVTEFYGEDKFYYQDFKTRWYFKLRIS